MADFQPVLDFWFAPGKSTKEQQKIWFAGKSVDEEIRSKFGDLIIKARNGELKAWEDNEKSSLAHILLIDQFCRSVYRGTADAFSHDPVALRIARKVIDSGKHKNLNAMERFFLYLTHQHAENIDIQNKSLLLYEELASDCQGTEFEDMAKSGVSYAKQHREVVEKYGRFPKRNQAIGRENTPEEEELLKNYPYGF
eukprot:Seg530.1 transcript_id=Seg530.1/GoldUCD/mRNA.D3Y31 product="hypothetical protein" protein_id=Seg530.1/GoldUCD/D3Y31